MQKVIYGLHFKTAQNTSNSQVGMKELSGLSTRYEIVD